MDWQETLQNLVNTVIGWASNTGIKILIALFLWFISFKIVNFITRRMEKRLLKKDLDKTIVHTLMYILAIVLKIAIIVCLVGYLGIDTSGLTALVVSLGACIGLAVNGALSNLAGGVLLIVTRPFKIDDFIEAQGHSGTVEEIHLTNTKIRTGDNKVVYIPNGPLSSGSIINYSEKHLRRLDLTFSIAYSNDFEKAKKIIGELCEAHELVLLDPAPTIRVASHNASSIDITTKVWVKNSDYWTVNFDLLEQVKTKFDENGIEIPFNQLDVHVKND